MKNFFSSIIAITVALMFSATAVPVHAGSSDLSKEDKACLSCHDKEGVFKVLENGEKLSLKISTDAYLASMHSETSCEDCHDDLDSKTHGREKSSIESKRDVTVRLQDSCRACHKKKFTEYDDSVHAALVKGGSIKAPLCANCHNPHTVQSTKVVTPMDRTPCAQCHEAIYLAYANDVHGVERAARGKAAPLCEDCHQAHSVQAASLGDGVKDACLSCHENAVAQHQSWLPNAARHFDAISCPACHAPAAQRRVNLRLYDSGGQVQATEKTGVPQFDRLTSGADFSDLGLDERALWSLLKEFNRDDAQGKVILRGRLEVSSGLEAHQISEKSKAIKDCKTCHQAGAAPFQSVSLTIAGPDGRPLRRGVRQEVLTSLTSMHSVRGFYAIGSTRIKMLDHLLVLVLVGAISVPLGHMTIKRMFKKSREKPDSAAK